MVEDQPFDLPPEVFKQVPLFAEIAKILSWQGGPVNWDIARQIAVAMASARGAEPLSERDTAEARENLRVAELWLTAATGLPEPSRLARPEVVTPAAWAERAVTTYRELLDPLAQRITAAMAGGPHPEAAEAQMLAQALRQIAPLFLGMQSGAVLGALACDVLTQYDLPLPVAEEGSAILVLPSIDAFADEYRLDRREARMWAAVHEAAHRIEFEGLPWVRTHFFALYHNYVAALEFDLGGVAERLQQLDLTSPEQLQAQLGEGGLVGLVDTPAVREALGRVQALVAMLEACADRAVEAAASGKLAGAPRLAEASARRRAEQTRGERLLQQFIGLDLGPGVRRPAERFSREVLAARGWSALNRLWDEPHNLPSEPELDDAASWIARVGT